MLLHQKIDQRLHAGAVHIQILQRLLRTGRAQIGQLGLVEIGHHTESMLQIVDAQLGRLAIGERADMAGDFQPTGMGRIDQAALLSARVMLV